ncbi:hypothetical protein G6F62_015667 [Rhizopus arrhizus]|nr:hypothetical protein G6F62_015667 [Rhizopus arrhizus]
MAVDKTPERSLSDLLSTSRAAEATTGCGPSPRWGVVIIRCKVSSNGLAGSERKLATPRSVLSSPAYRTCKIAPTSSAWLVFSQ